MKRYVSLAGAMLLGSVIAQNKETATVTLKLSSGAELKEAEITAKLMAAAPKALEGTAAVYRSDVSRYTEEDGVSANVEAVSRQTSKRDNTPFDVETSKGTSRGTSKAAEVAEVEEAEVEVEHYSEMTYNSVGFQTRFDYSPDHFTNNDDNNYSFGVESRFTYESANGSYYSVEVESFYTNDDDNVSFHDDDFYNDDDYPGVHAGFYDDETTNEYDIFVKMERGYAGVCGVQYRFAVGDTYWCDDRQYGMRTHCTVASANLHLCCVEYDGCDDADDMRAWRF